MANYPVPEELIRPYLPPGVEPDRRAGQCWVSLVAFQFLDSKVKGIPLPGYQSFAEWNLRLYDRQGDRQGVTFIREFVSRRLVALGARLTYNEPYRIAPVTMDVTEGPDEVRASYTVERRGRTHRLAAVGARPGVRPGPESDEHFFKERHWGFGQTHRGHLQHYQVDHPVWEVYPLQSHEIDVDWGLLYGAEWAVMNRQPPASVFLAAGSAVGVSPRGTGPIPS
jgi:uncharacterized protein YqjF (DUF2071 family)